MGSGNTGRRGSRNGRTPRRSAARSRSCRRAGRPWPNASAARSSGGAARGRGWGPRQGPGPGRRSWVEYISGDEVRHHARARRRMPVASCDKEYAPGGHAGSQPARAAERSGQRVARAAGRHGAERRAVLAARRRHADGRRSGTGVRRPQVLYRAGRPHARGQRHRAALDQLGHGVRPAVEQAASHGPLVRARLPLRLPPGRSWGPRADPHRRLRGRRALGRAAGLLRPRGRLPPATPAGDDLSRARPGSSGPSGPAPSELILRGGDVLLQDVEWRVERGDVVVRDGRIAAVGWLDPKGSRGPTGRKRAETVVRDCTGCLVMPGLIQAHVHLCQTLFRGLGDDLRLEDWLARRIWPLEAAHTEETVAWSALLRAAELLLGGTTAILDMETVHHTGAAFEALDRSGIRATAGEGLMGAHPEGAPLELAAATGAALAEAGSLARGRAGGAGGGRRGGGGGARLRGMPRPGWRGARGAEGGACRTRLDAFAEMRLAALIQKPRHGADVLSAGQVLELATAGGARALGLQEELGAIAVGRRADLVVLDLRGPHLAPTPPDPVSHLVYAAQPSDVRDVFVDGRAVVLDRDLLTVSVEEVVREAARCGAELRRRTGLA